MQTNLQKPQQPQQQIETTKSFATKALLLPLPILFGQAQSQPKYEARANLSVWLSWQLTSELNTRLKHFFELNTYSLYTSTNIQQEKYIFGKWNNYIK